MLSHFDLYPRSRASQLDPELFLNPTAEYRGAPFWSWNNKLDIPQLLRQIACLQQMGMGGFQMHARTGLDTEYLGNEFMAAVSASVEEARRRGMLAWLYDEDRWPSGYGGGFVTRDYPEFRQKHLLWTTIPYPNLLRGEPPDSRLGDTRFPAARERTENGILLAVFDLFIDDLGSLADYRRVDAQSPVANSAGWRRWYAYVETELSLAWFSNSAYVDTLKPAAIAKFLEVVYDRYADVCQADFGKLVPAIFTDEPQFSRKQPFRSATDTIDLTMPYTDDFGETYRAAYGQSLEDHFPELFWELPAGAVSLVRYRYHEHVAERFAQAFADQIGGWCERHSIALTGHMMDEYPLTTQSGRVGDAMRSYRSMQIPGIDLLCDRQEYFSAKQAQSAARQYGRCGVLSELYGVTNWDFPFAGHKTQGDWQAALGITVRVHHLAWASMQGEAKRDYPASIGYQSPWFAEYPLIEDHFSRLNTVLTRGEAVAHVAMIHPIESLWLCSGPTEQTARERHEIESRFADLTRWLLFDLIDFDYIAESLLPELCPENADQAGQALAVGKMRYKVVLVPGLRTIRSSTLARLSRFADSGGRVIFLGSVPELVDAVPSKAPAELAARCELLPMSRARLAAALDPIREFAANAVDGSPASTLLHQIRSEDGGRRRHLFVCNTQQEPANYALDRTEPLRLRIRGCWALRELDTMTGEQRAVAAEAVNQAGETWTQLWREMPAQGSLLLELTQASEAEMGRASGSEAAAGAQWTEIARLSDPVPVTLSEPNVLLLDRPEYRFGQADPWEGPQEALRVGNIARRQFGLGDFSGEIAQPWTDTAPAPQLGALHLRYTIVSDTAVDGALLAVEQPESLTIMLNGKQVATSAGAIRGYFVDEAILTIPLPAIPVGTSSLEITIPFTRKTSIEWCYLLGDFGVHLAGSHARLTEPVRSLAWGDWTRQGLPFYAGNVTYHAAIPDVAPLLSRGTTDLAGFAISVPHFSSPLLSLASNGTVLGKIAFAPYRLLLEDMRHRASLDITAYGNRVNAFGPVHNCNSQERWFGPTAWRSRQAAWSDQYQLKPMGVLVAPALQRRESPQSP